MWIPVEKSWRLNERHYGALQGLNTLRALVKYVDGISDADIPELEIPTGIPLIYELEESLRRLARYYLGNSPVVAQAQEALDHVVRNSGSVP